MLPFSHAIHVPIINVPAIVGFPQRPCTETKHPSHHCRPMARAIVWLRGRHKCKDAEPGSAGKREGSIRQCGRGIASLLPNTLFDSHWTASTHHRRVFE